MHLHLIILAKKKKKKVNRRVRHEWNKEFSWLVEKDDSIFCKYCNTALFKNHAHLKRHEDRVSHQERVKSIRSTVDLSQYLKENARKELLFFKTKRAEFKLVMALVEHNLPFAVMDHLPQLLKNAAPDSEILKQINCARTKTTAMVKFMAEEAKSCLADTLKTTKFSIIIDKTTDISVTKCLAVLVRYADIDRKTIKDQLIGLLQINDLSAGGITTSVLNLFESLKIPSSNVIGFAADNASVMMDNFRGVQAKLKEVIHDIFVVGCICHSMALCASSAANKLPKEIEDFVRNIFNYLNGSARLQEYKESKRGE